MKGTDLLIAFVLSCTVHAGIFVGASLLQPSEMLYRSGNSAAIYDVEIISARSAPDEAAASATEKAPVVSSAPAMRRPLKPASQSPRASLESKAFLGAANSKGYPSATEGPVAVRGLVKPPYPPFAREHGIEGRVVLKAFITESGLVAKVETVQTSGHDILDQAASKALKEAEFLPARLDEKPIASSKVLAFRFSLRD